MRTANLDQMAADMNPVYSLVHYKKLNLAHADSLPILYLESV